MEVLSNSELYTAIKNESSNVTSNNMNKSPYITLSKRGKLQKDI